MKFTDHDILTGLAALTPAQLAERWGVCRQTIYNMIIAGELHSFKIRNSRRIPASEVVRLESIESPLDRHSED